VEDNFIQDLARLGLCLCRAAMIIIRESNRELHEEQIENGRMLAQENERKKIMKYKT
jgi:hypothetical protein